MRAPPPTYPDLGTAIRAVWDDPIAFGIAVGYRGDKRGRKQFGALHRLIADRLLSSTRTSTLVPRNHGKSTVISEIFPAWSLMRDPSLRIMICSATNSLSEELVGKVRDILNGVFSFTIDSQVVEIPLKEIFPHAAPRTRADATGSTKHFNIKGRSGEGKEYSVFASSPKSAATGKHPTMILVDDPCDDKNTLTFDMRQKGLSWFLSLDPILQDYNDPFHHIGTVWAANDTSQFISDDPEFQQLRLRAWVPENPETGIADGLGPGPLPGGRWEEKYKGHYPLDPSYRSVEELHKDERKSEIANKAHFFAAQYLNEPMVAGDTIFPDDIILGCSYPQVPHFDDYPEILLWDPTGRLTGTKGDANGIVIAQPVPAKVWCDATGEKRENLEDDRNIFIIRYAKQVHGGSDDALQVVEALCEDRPNIKTIWIEDVASQLALKPWLEERGNIKGVTVRGQKIGTSSQPIRLQGMATAMRQGQVVLPMDFPGRDLLVTQLTEYPKSDFDDVPTAFSLLGQHRERRGSLPGLPQVEYNRHDPTGLWPEQMNRVQIRRGGPGF